MELDADPLRFSQYQLCPLPGLVPVFPGDPAVFDRAYQKLGIRIQQLVIQQASSGMVRLAAEDCLLDIQLQTIRHLSGKNGVFISIGSLIFL